MKCNDFLKTDSYCYVKAFGIFCIFLLLYVFMPDRSKHEIDKLKEALSNEFAMKDLVVSKQRKCKDLYDVLKLS